MRHNITILLLAVLLLAACHPLRKVQRNQKTDSTVVDRSEIRKAVTDILRESGTFTQTVVEFYPPVAASEVGENMSCPAPPDGNGDNSIGAALPTADPSKLRPPVVKRIIHTEIATEKERTTTTDSTAHNDIRTESHSELAEKVAEKPPAATATIKWIAIALAAIAAIILLLKFPR